MLSQARDRVGPVRRALARPLAALGISPDLLSLLAIPLSLLAAFWAHQGDWTRAGWLAAGAFFLDFIDGEVARLQNRQSPVGNCTEAIIDRVVELILLSGLCRWQPLAAVLAVGTGFLVSYVKARVGLVIVSDNRDWPGVGDRADRCLLIVLALGTGQPVFLWLLIALSVVGATQRTMHARTLIREAQQDGRLLPYLAAK